mgnify:CR=1 FL=1
MKISDGQQWLLVGGGKADGSSASRAAQSAVEIKETNPAATTGVYWIKPQNWSGQPQQIYCDMTTDGGGWMMVGYAGTISGNKSSTVGSNWLPLFNTYGSIDSNAKSNRSILKSSSLVSGSWATPSNLRIISKLRNALTRASSK